MCEDRHFSDNAFKNWKLMRGKNPKHI